MEPGGNAAGRRFAFHLIPKGRQRILLSRPYVFRRRSQTRASLSKEERVELANLL
jgi:hypothetical protein